MNLTEYNQAVDIRQQAMTPRERRIIQMQDELEELKSRSSFLEEKIKAELDVLGENYNHDMFRVADVKIIRVADAALVRERHPDYFSSSRCYPTAKALGELLSEVYGIDNLIDRLEQKAPEKLDEIRSIRVSDMDKVFGKKETDELCYRKTMMTSKTRLVPVRQPGEFSMFNAPKRNVIPERDYSDLPEDA